MKHPITHNPPWVLKCAACFEWKEETAFHPNQENRTGRAGTCIACRRLQIKLAQRERRAKTRALRAAIGLAPEVANVTSRSDVGKPHTKKKEARTERWNPRPDAPITRVGSPDNSEPTQAPVFTDLFKFGPGE